MTALVTLEHVHRLGDMFTQNGYRSAAEDSQIGLVPGERMSVHDLMIALMLPSADDAAEDLAFNVGHGSVARFVGMMNARARQLGLVHTHYSTPIGLDTPGNYSSASDLVKLAGYLLRHLAVLQAGRRAQERGSAYRQPRRVRSSTETTSSPRSHGSTASRPATRCRRGTSWSARGRRNGMTLISAVIGTPDEAVRDASTLSLLDYGFANFALRTPVRKGDVLARPSVKGRDRLHAPVVAGATFQHVFARTARVHLRVNAPEQLTGPLGRHARVGTVVVLSRGKVVKRVPLVVAKAVPAAPAPGSASGSSRDPLRL